MANPFPPYPIPKIEAPAWSANDETRQRQLVAELEQLQARREAAVSKLQNILEACQDLGEPIDIARVIEHADELRDALEPFDSGVRKAPCGA